MSFGGFVICTLPSVRMTMHESIDIRLYNALLNRYFTNILEKDRRLETKKEKESRSEDEGDWRLKEGIDRKCDPLKV